MTNGLALPSVGRLLVFESRGMADSTGRDVRPLDWGETGRLRQAITAHQSLRLSTGVHCIPHSIDLAGSGNPIRIFIVENHQLVADTLAAFFEPATGHAGRGQRRFGARGGDAG